MNPLEIAVPWNIPRYIPCNGFHPLYRPLFEGRSNLKFNVVDEAALAKLLAKGDEVVSQIRAELTANFFPASCGEKIAKELSSYITPIDHWISREIPGAIEFHHTSPLTTGTRPFVFHCESFLPIFMPFSYQGTPALKRYDELRKFYGRLLASPLCLAIFSHISVTLEQISEFFRNKEIDRKLVYCRIGISDRTLASLVTAKTPIDLSCPVFLFTSSAHQNPSSFALRGGGVALRFAERYLRSGRRGRFIFRAARPTDTELKRFGLDVDFLKSKESRDLRWIEGYIHESEQLRLFAEANILLLPSSNLHSVTLMQAMAAGTIPVVTDTYGADVFVKDGKTGIVLNGVRGHVWRTDNDSGVPVDDHKRFSEIMPKLADKMHDRLIEILAESQKCLRMSSDCREWAKNNFSGTDFTKQFSGEVEARFAQATNDLENMAWRAKKTFFFSEGLFERERFSDLFESPPVPAKLKDEEYATIFFGKGVYYCFSASARADYGLNSWFPLHLKLAGILSPQGVSVVSTLQEVNERVLPGIKMVWLRRGVFARTKRWLSERARRIRYIRYLYNGAKRMLKACRKMT